MTVDGYFAASNSGRGFANYYSEVFGEAGRIFVIKGGPGTGKSRFMREVEKYSAARGWRCRRYYCSSDPASLDGILLCRGDETLALLDGTPPHVWEPAHPGVVEQLVNLGDFWDAALLRERRGELFEHERLKRRAWRQAYSWLSGCLDMCVVIRGIGQELVDGRALEEYAASMLAGTEPGDGFHTRTALLNAVGMTGQATSDGFIVEAKTLYIVRDSFMTAHRLLDCVIEQSQKRGLAVTISRDPIDPERVDGVLLERDRVAIVVTDANVDRASFSIEMSSLNLPASEDAVNEMIHAGRAYDSMLSSAIDTLTMVREHHFAMEAIYSSAMDFAAKERFTAEFCRKVFGE